MCIRDRDYAPVNIRLDEGEVQGDWAMSGIGAYDMWAIEYGYTFAPKPDAILARVAEPELAYATDEDTSGPDPFARRYDFSKKPLEYAQSQMNLAVYHRDRILQKFVKKGDSWAKASRGYNITLSLQTRSLSMLANWSVVSLSAVTTKVIRIVVHRCEWCRLQISGQRSIG